MSVIEVESLPSFQLLYGYPASSVCQMRLFSLIRWYEDAHKHARACLLVGEGVGIENPGLDRSKQSLRVNKLSVIEVESVPSFQLLYGYQASSVCQMRLFFVDMWV